MASFFGAIYEIFNPVPVPIPVPAPVTATVVPVNAFIPVALPARFVPIAFVPASSASFPHHCMTTRSSA